MGLREERRRIIASQPHPVTETGGVITFDTDMKGALQITGSGNITVAGRNLYDYTQRKVGYYIGTDGTEKVSAQDYIWNISPYIKVDGLAKVTYFGLTSTGSAPRSAWYDANKTLLTDGVFKQQTGRNTLTVPNGAAFVRFSVLRHNTVHDWENFAVMPGETDAAFEAYSGSSDQVSHPGYNTVWSDSGDITVTYWTH